MNRAPASLITAIDIGTTKICVIVAQQAPDASLRIIAIGQSPSRGLSRGVVVAIAPTVSSIQDAVREAELMAGHAITHAYIGISGSHIQSFTSHGMVPITRGEIREQDITNVMTAARAITLPEGQQLIHAVPHSFIVNSTEVIRNPLGMYAVRLEARVHMITGSVASVHNLIRCCELAGITVQDIVLEPLASAAAVLSEDERELGIGILDIGGGTSDFAVYNKGSICHTHIIPIAGTMFTNDIAVCLRTSLHEAERIKKQYGTVGEKSLSIDTTLIDIEHADGTERGTITTHDLNAVLSARSQELLHMIVQEIDRSGVRPLLSAGVVITGGGALLHGLREQASAALRMPVRIGIPQASAYSNTLHHPMHATGYGIIMHILSQQQGQTPVGPIHSRIFAKMRSWFGEIF